MFVSSQLFNESIDNSRRQFTTTHEFTGQLIVTQGNLVVHDFAYVGSETILFTTAPQVADGDLRWAGNTVEEEVGGTQAAFLLGIMDRIHDTESKLTSASLLDCLDSALNEYSHRRPRYLVAELEGDGTAFVTLPDDWDATFSKVVRIDRLNEDGEPEFVEPADYALIENPAPEGQILFFYSEDPTASDTFNLKYAVRHSIGATSSTVPSADEPAIMDLAASFALLRMAAAYAQSTDPQLGTVTLDYKSKVSEYKGLAGEYRKQFDGAMSAPGKAAANGRRTWTPTTGKWFH